MESIATEYNKLITRKVFDFNAHLSRFGWPLAAISVSISKPRQVPHTGKWFPFRFSSTAQSKKILLVLEYPES